MKTRFYMKKGETENEATKQQANECKINDSIRVDDT